MRIVTIDYCCVVYPKLGSCLSLWIDFWHMKSLPLTYTVQECLEEWCEEVGWRYLSHVGGLSHVVREFFPMRVKVPLGAGLESTILKYVKDRENEN